MTNKAIIDKLRWQVQILVKRLDWTDDHALREWVDRSKIYILGLWLDKNDDYFRKEVIKMLEKYKDRIPTYDNLDLHWDKEEAAKDIRKDILRLQSKLRNVLESFIEILELREEDLWDNGNEKLQINIVNYSDQKKSNKK